MTLAVRGGLIVEIAPGLDAPAHEVNNARGLLLSPPFADAQFHMDACLSYAACRASTKAARCSKAVRCGANSNRS